VTDTCILRKKLSAVCKNLVKAWKDAKPGRTLFPHEFLYKVVLSGDLEQYYEIDPKDSWIVAARQEKYPHCRSREWEDSTTGNIFASYVIKNELKAKVLSRVVSNI